MDERIRNWLVERFGEWEKPADAFSGLMVLLFTVGVYWLSS